MPGAIDVGDFNNDGNADLVVTNNSVASATILLGDGNFGFSATPPISVGTTPDSIAVGDFDNDGNKDFVTANAGANNVSVRFGDGTGGSSHGTDVNVGSAPSAVAIGDFNGDGKQDFAATNSGLATTSIRLGVCVPAVSIPGTYLQPEGYTGTTDFVILATLSASSTQTITVDFTTSDDTGGTHPATPAATCGAGIDYLTTSDVCLITIQNDDTLPTAVTYSNRSIPLASDITLTPAAPPSNTTSINVSTSTDFKGTFTDDPVTGTLRITNTYPAGVYTVTVTAFGVSGSVSKPFTLTVDPGTACSGVSNFTSAADVSVGNSPVSAAIGDFNNDGKQDLAVANLLSDTVSVRLGDGAGGFTGATEVSVGAAGSAPISVAIGDFNNDGNQDLAIANRDLNNVAIRLGDGLGNFTGTTQITVGTGPLSIAVGDFNNDGEEDIAVANSTSNTVSIRLGDGLGGFSGTTEVPVGSSPTSVAIGDFNNDGKPDLAVANANANTVSIRLGDGLGGFGGATEIPVGTNPQSVVIGDFNNDGKQDIAVANKDVGTVSIRVGDGLGGFGGTTEVNVGTNPVAVAIGDFDNNSNQDTATANAGAGTVSIRFGDGAGGFSATGTNNFSVGPSPYWVAIGDFNGDGKQDFATANNGSNTASIRLGVCLDSTVQFSAADFPVTEGDTGTQIVPVTVTRTGSTGPVSVHYAISDGTATVADNDYVATSGDLTWTNDDTTPRTINVTINGDTIFEPDETINLTLSNASGATLGTPNTATVTIINNDPQPSISINDVTLPEGNSGQTAFNFTVSLTNASSQTVTVHYSTAGGSAASPTAYTAVADTVLTFNPGETSKLLTVEVNGNTVYEANKTFFVNLTSASGATIARAQGVGTITNDDAPPTTLVVNNSADTDDGTCTTDPGGCTLREAINTADASLGSNTIIFNIPIATDSGCNGGAGPCTISLDTALPDISDDLNINGPNLGSPGETGIIVKRSTALLTGNFRVFTIDPGTKVAIDRLTVSNGKISDALATDQGGGIFNAGTLKLTNSTVSDNNVGGTQDDEGGGIYSSGTLTVTNVAFSNNSATGGGDDLGGAIFSTSGTATITGSSFSGNSTTGSGNDRGGAIYVDSGTVNVTDSTPSANKVKGGTTDQGGGIYVNGGTLNLTSSTLSDNAANGLTADQGGGIFVNGGSVVIINSTLSSNLANGTGKDQGGGIYTAAGTLQLTNCTIASNAATNGLTSNGGGGIANDLGAVNVRNTIIALNTADIGLDVFGTFASQGHNFIGKSDGSTGFGMTGDQVGSLASAIDPLLGVLASNGGPTQTRALLAGSTAIDGGDDCVVSSTTCANPVLTTDQRGAGFTRQVDGNNDGTAVVDIGAFEAATCTPPATPPASNGGPYCEG